jgi:hypothetical protein
VIFVPEYVNLCRVADVMSAVRGRPEDEETVVLDDAQLDHLAHGSVKEKNLKFSIDHNYSRQRSGTKTSKGCNVGLDQVQSCPQSSTITDTSTISKSQPAVIF